MTTVLCLADSFTCLSYFTYTTILHLSIGFFLALVASVVALWGVYLFNQKRDYTGARDVWFWSNSLFVVYFAGRCVALWDGGLGDAVMALYFLLMWWSNWRGMV